MNEVIQQYIVRLDNRQSRASLVTLVIIVTIGFLLRLWYLYAGHAYHYLAINDEITAYEFAMRFLAGDTSTYYLGQPDFAGGKAPGPYFTLSWVLVWLIGGKSLDGALFVILLFNSAVILLIYRFARCFLENRYALLTAALFATAPWTVYYAVGLWNPMLLAILGVLLLMSLWYTAVTDNSRMIFWVCIVLAIVPHFHMIGLFYFPAVLLVLYGMPAKVNIRWFAIGIVAGFVLYIPYLLGDALHGWQNLRAILSGDSQDTFSFSVLKILTAPATVLSSVPSRWVGPEFSETIEFGNRYFGSYIILIIVALISMLFSLYVVYAFLANLTGTLRRNKFSLKRAFNDQSSTVYLGIMLFVPLLMFLPTGHNYATRYTIIIFPLLFLILGMRIMRLYNSRYKKLLTGGIIFIVLFNIYLHVVFSQHTSNMFQSGKQFMPSFRKLEEIRQQVASNIDGVPVVSLSEKSLKLSELNKTLHVALPGYFNIYYRYIDPAGDRPGVNLYISPDSVNISQQDIVYRGNGIVLLRKAAQN